ncbi:hypothetical protein VNO77_42194 [Canavalia gladiata]|uniref:Homing endonuclease LAGLIDADG domain-containing protein n=1 Tax=Canavalia gladiata TaxID=3824 RepID=A0AAN9JZT0_CANGL
MVVRVRSQDLLLPLPIIPLSLNNFSNPNLHSMRSTFTLFRSLSLSLSNLQHSTLPSPLLPRPRRFPRFSLGVQHVVAEEGALPDNEAYRFDRSSSPAAEATELKKLRGPEVEVVELRDVPEEWRRARVAWLCKELPAHKAGTLPRLSLHNSLFKALVSKPGIMSKHYLKQAEFIYHQLVTTGLDVHKDIYGGLIWLHSYQDSIDKGRIAELRKEMLRAGIEERTEVLVSILRACAREGEVEEAEKTWFKLLKVESDPPAQAFVYKMEVYSKVGMPMKSLEIFREMQLKPGIINVAAYNQIIEILCKAQESEFAESIMADFVKSGLKPLTPSYVYLLNMYFNLELHDKLEETLSQCLERCRPNCTIYTIYLNSLVKIGNVDKADDLFNQMNRDVTIGINGRSCNIILSGYLSSGNHLKAEKIYDLMCLKKYEIEPPLMEKLDYILSLKRKIIKKPISQKLSKDQREILIGLLLGGLRIDSDDQRRNHIIRFDFDGNSSNHYVLKSHIYRQFYEWLHPTCKPSDDSENIPNKFCTIASSQFCFYADQFWSKGEPTIPKLIHRWMSPCVLAYWYMYGGHRNSSGDILLKIKGSREGVENIVKKFKAMSMDCKVKRKGRIFWIGILGSNSTWFWKLVEPYIIEDKDFPEAGDHMVEKDSMQTEDINFGSDSDK